MDYQPVKFVVFLWFSLSSAALAGTNAIVPGRSIGQLCLGEAASTATTPLGLAASNDSAMGNTWQVWKSGYELDVLTIRDESGLHTFVEQVRVTSPWFATRRGIHVGSSFSAVRAAFPKMLRLNPDAKPTEHQVLALYDNVNQGILFEFAAAKHGVPSSAKCQAILVHPKRKTALLEYSDWYMPDDIGVLRGQNSPFWKSRSSMTHHL